QAALAEQTQTGRRLGEIVVERGYMSGAALANALATQHGGVVRTEYGIATGLPERANEPEAAPDASEPAERTASRSLLHVLEDWSAMLEELRAKVARLETELEAAKAELDVSKSTLQATTGALEVAKRDLQTAREQTRAAQAQLAEAKSRAEQVERAP